MPPANLPGWRWARIKQLALVGLSSSRHSEACNALGGPFGVAHSIISVHGFSRPRGGQRFRVSDWETAGVDFPGTPVAAGTFQKSSTVLEQDHFCSALLRSHETVLTNSQNHEDELSWRRTGKWRPGDAFIALPAALMKSVIFRHKGLSDRETIEVHAWIYQDPERLWLWQRATSVRPRQKKARGDRVLARRFTLSQNGYGEHIAKQLTRHAKSDNQTPGSVGAWAGLASPPATAM